MHICRGYPNKEKDVKAEKENYKRVIEALSKSGIDRISVEDAHEHLDNDTFERFGTKGIMLGVVDIGEERVETPDEIEKRAMSVADCIRPNKIYLAPDCGLILLKPEIARAKLSSMALASENLRKSFK